MSSSYSHQDWTEALSAPSSLKDMMNQQVALEDEELEQDQALEEDSQAHRLRVDVITRLFAFGLDLALVIGFSGVLIYFMNAFFESFLKAYGFQLSPGMMFLPVALLYLSYFSAEATQGRTLGKLLLGIELRRENGDKASASTLFRRSLLKHLGTMCFIPMFLYEHPLLILVAWAGVGWYLIHTFTAISSSRQSLIDRVTELAIYPKTLPKTNLARLAGNARTDKEIKAELLKARKAKQQKGDKKKSKTPPAEAFPCGAEIKVYARPREGIEEELLDCFARFIQNVYPDQIKEFPPKGNYSAYKIVMRFSSPLEMEASYEALAKVPGGVTILPLKLVRLPKQEGGLSCLKRPARAVETSPVSQEQTAHQGFEMEEPLS